MEIIKLGEEESVPKEIKADKLVYKYSHGSYEGSGFAAWKLGDKYFYHEMGHCSCNGPWDNIESSANIGITLKELKEVAEKSYGTDAKLVVNCLETHV